MSQKNTLYLGNLDESVTEPFLYNIYRAFGNINSLVVVKDLY